MALAEMEGGIRGCLVWPVSFRTCRASRCHEVDSIVEHQAPNRTGICSVVFACTYWLNDRRFVGPFPNSPGCSGVLLGHRCWRRSRGGASRSPNALLAPGQDVGRPALGEGPAARMAAPAGEPTRGGDRRGGTGVADFVRDRSSGCRCGPEHTGAARAPTVTLALSPSAWTTAPVPSRSPSLTRPAASRILPNNSSLPLL